jgi:hypothetical protein
VPSYRAVLDREGAESPAEVAVIGSEREIEHAINRLADAGATHFVANPAMFTTPEEHARTVSFLGSLRGRRSPAPLRRLRLGPRPEKSSGPSHPPSFGRKLKIHLPNECG